MGVVEYGSVTNPNPFLLGDADGDGDVDGDDLIAVQTEFGNVGSVPLLGDADNDGDVDGDDLIAVQTEFGNVASTAVPEPGAATLIGLVLAGLASLRSRKSAAAVAVVAGLTLACGEASAVVTLDRDYKFGDDSRETGAAPNAFAGTGAPNGNLLDSAGEEMMNQIITLVIEAPVIQPRYVDVSDRPDISQGLVTITDENGSAVPTPLGIALNPFALGSTFNEQYLRTGFEQALNFPERSPSSTFSPLPGTINYDLISDRGFQLWTKPTPSTGDVTDFGEQHIVMDSNQHGVLINPDGEFAMRYAWSQDTIDQEAITQGVDPSELADLFDSPTGVMAQANTWYHLSVVRPLGPNNGSILYVNGEAVAAATGTYNVEEVPTDDFGQPDLTQLDTSPLVIGANTGNPSFGDNNYYTGVVDDLEMFIMGINADNVFPDYVFEIDNEYASAFKPTLPGDVDGDDDVDLDDASDFASNWLYENRVPLGGPNADPGDFLVVGDLVSRSRGDLNYDGIVDLADWAILNNANPSMATAAAQLIAGIPEPGAAVLLALGALPLLGRPRG